ncbi:hypothetical protein C1H46_006032 [Malus baccata]|uniref:Retrotransposon gag domain-containing protein n=1 Tax=Malus baccata TaxID=106549 RepID=A0A540NBK2_MALBA|nr:hypothetical protein C1H46_006032 [Malus baccata]
MVDEGSRGEDARKLIKSRIRAEEALGEKEHWPPATKASVENLPDRTDLKNTLREVMGEEMRDIQWASKPKNPDYSDEEVPLPFSKELLDKPTSGDTRALKMQSYKRLTDPYDHLEGFIYAFEGRGNNDATKCKLFPTTLRGAARDWFK